MQATREHINQRVIGRFTTEDRFTFSEAQTFVVREISPQGLMLRLGGSNRWYQMNEFDILEVLPVTQPSEAAGE